MKVFALLLVLAVPALADWKSQVTPPRLGPQPRLAPIQVDYKLSWNGMLNAGKLTFTFGKPDPSFPSDYVSRASGGSSGIAGKLYPCKIAYVSRMDPATLRPRAFTGVQDEGKEVTTTSSKWAGPRVSTTQVTRNTRKGTETNLKGEFRFTPVHDLFSAMLHVRSHKLNNGDSLTLPLMPTNKPYLLRVKVLGREQLNGRNTIKMSVALQKIDPKSQALLPYKKMKSSTLWISDDAHRIPVEVRSEVFIGDVRMTLSHAKPL